MLRKFRGIKSWLSCLPDEAQSLANFDQAAIKCIDSFLTDLGHCTDPVRGEPRSIPPTDRRNRTAMAAKKVFADPVT